MKNLMKLSGLMMSALLCMFASCTSNDEKEDEIQSGPKTVEATVYIASETLDCVEGSFIVESLPSGKKSEISANSVMFAFDATTEADKGFTKGLTSKKIKKASLTIVCDASEKEVTITPNLKVKSGLQIDADGAYTYEVAGVLSQKLGLNGAQTPSNTFAHTVKGSAFESLVESNNTTLERLELMN